MSQSIISSCSGTLLLMATKYKVALYFFFVYYYVLHSVGTRQRAQKVSRGSPWRHWKWCCLVGGKGMLMSTMISVLYILLASLRPVSNSLEDGTRLSYCLRRVQTGFIEQWKHWKHWVQPSRSGSFVVDGTDISIATGNEPSQLRARYQCYSRLPPPLCPNQPSPLPQSTFARSQWG